MFEAIYCDDGHLVARVPGRSPFRTRRLMEGMDEEERRLLYCTKCGKPTINCCPNPKCKASIVVEYDRPSYCGSCGKPFPWTQVALQAANEYTDELEGLSDGDKTMLKKSYGDLTIDSPRTPLAASRFKRILMAAGPTAKDMVTEILKGTLTNVAKELLGIKG